MIGTAPRNDQWDNAVAMTAFLMMTLATILLSGCKEREKVLDVDTPAGSIEVYENEDNPNVNPE